ncbi:DUF4349 domain-containing protein [Leucobacter aridicollis]|uniref:DUF4349 domain-containing protein n=1 Tax=Leucobacter aridicollis TaxID=283878 RepID=UPI0021031313|nr:DUF4349 domain-containing protein [Leucobacter aridicollis]UTX54200.1 DUF4349 domain-containing protein [Leucobacter aridicollis]
MNTKRFLAGLAATLVAVGLAGCSASSSDVAGVPAVDSMAGGEFASAADASVEQGSGLLDGNREAVQSESRSIIRSASLALTVKSVRAAADDVAEVAKRLDGSVSSQSISGDGGAAATGEVSLRVPAERLDEAVLELSKLGDVTSDSRSADDVTETHVDLAARVAALESSVKRLTDLMAGAATTSELIEAESALSARQQELDGLKAQLESLEGQVSQASIWVSLSEQSPLPGGGPSSFWDALKAGVASIGSFFVGAFVGLGFALPWLALLAIVAVAVLIPLRRRRRRARIADTPEKPLSADPAESVAEDPTS